MSIDICTSRYEREAKSREIRTVLLAWTEISLVCGAFLLMKLIPGLLYSGAIGIAVATGVATLLMRLRGQRWSDLGLRWTKSPSDYLKAVAMIVVVFCAVTLTNLIVPPLLEAVLGTKAARSLPDVSTLGRYLTVMVIVWTTAAFGEEMLCRGFLMNRIAGLAGNGRRGWTVAAFCQAALFGLAHSYQGIGGVLLTGIVGLVFGLLYLAAKRNLWPLIIAHGLINSFGITVLYLMATGVVPPA